MLTPEEQAELDALNAELSGTASKVGLSSNAKAFAGKSDPTKLDEFLGGLKHSADRAAYGVKSLLPKSIQDLGDELDRKLGLGGLNKETYEQGKAFVDESSGLANAGDIIGDILMGLVPGGAAMRGGQVLKGALASKGLFNTGTKLATEAAGNAAWNAATAPEDREKAAILGGAGSALGSVANRLISGPMAGAVTPEARRLMAGGVGLTAGQMASGSRVGALPRAMRGLEESTTAIPFVGDMVKHRYRGSIEDWNKLEINKALKSTGITVKEAGIAGFDDARSALREQFDGLVEHISIKPSEAKQMLDDLGEGLANIPMLNEKQANYLSKWINLHLGKHLTGDEVIDGRTARAIDRGIEEEITKWETKGSAWDQTMVDALEQVQGGWRSVMQSAEGNPKAVEKLHALIKAQDELATLKKASDKTSSGLFAPIQLQRVYERQNRPFSQSLKDAKVTLPQKIPTPGGAERAFIYHLAAPRGVAGLATGAGLLTGMAPLFGTAAALGTAYTKAGTKYLGSGIGLGKNFGTKLSRDEVEHAIKLLSQQSARSILNDYNQE